VTVIAAGTAPGTCLAFGPLQGNRRQTVFVDPGHGGVDAGASGTTSAGMTVYEKNLTLATGLDLLHDLREDGFRVVMSRVDDRLLIRPSPSQVSGGVLTAAGYYDNLKARIACANAAHAEALIAIHFNAIADPSVGGAETLYDNARLFSKENIRLATLVQRSVLAALHADGWDVPDRGIIDDLAAGTPAHTARGAAYGHLLELGPAAKGWLDHPSAMPGVLVEPLFLTRPSEADIAASTRGQQAIARGLALAVRLFTTTAHG
jgi:N-acetylmuramoyl-L-alanine amidase